jgi:c-di-AMP phosphodiesterase-like protein
MPSNNRKVLDKLVSRVKVYLVLILILLVIICALNTEFIIPSIIAYIVILGYTYFANNKRKIEISEELQDLTLTVDSAAKGSLISSPFPLIILETDGKVVWRNVKFTTEFANVDINNYLEGLLADIKKDNSKDASISKQEKIGTREYKILGEFVKAKNNRRKQEYLIILYFIDNTDNVKMQEEYENSKSCVGIITVDNYEEAMQTIDSDQKTQVAAKIERCIYDWTELSSGVLIKEDRDTYVYIFEQRYLKKITENKFSVLDTIKEIKTNAKTQQLTLSIAVSNDGNTDKEKYETALETMNIVLGRGGDQAAVREDGQYKFYGGRVEEIEKRTKVKARIVSHALEELISESKDVIIMGHSNPDIDAIGSSLGVYRIAKSLGKEANIVCETAGTTLENFLNDLSKQEEYNGVLINRADAVQKISEETLLVVVDTHKISYVEEPELLKKTKKIVIIDHHRRSADYIENAILTFQEVYASSAAELVTELLQYVPTKIELTTTEAESLYAGIMMDTKNFTFKTGVRTFEAAAYLRKCGVDIIRVKKWFQSDLNSFNKIAEIVRRTELVKDTIGISEKDKDSSLMCAKAADELLTISNITASFVLGKVGDKVTISGRSLGDINVQVILEKLGGGGHINLAGAQIEGTVEDVKAQLIEKINEYFED